MREYTITMSFSIETEESDYEQIVEFAEQLTENIMNKEDLILCNDIEVVGIVINEIQDLNYDDDNIYLDDDED